jgi:hypothetical protein
MENQMKQKKPTPGPYMWKHNEDVTRSIMIYTADGKAAVAKLVTHIHEYGVEYVEEAEANATLLTAAPDMFTALKQMQCSLSGSPGDFAGMLAAHRAVDAAIAKAEGR